MPVNVKPSLAAAFKWLAVTLGTIAFGNAGRFHLRLPLP